MAYEVTIGIPVYNVEKYIRLTMDSTLAQTFESIEFLVLDDCGTDSSMNIVREYQQQHPRGKDIRIVRQPQNMGIGLGRNRIIDEAQGRYLFFLDADDILPQDAIYVLYKAMMQHHAQIVFGSHEHITDYGEDAQTEMVLYTPMSFDNNEDFCHYAYDKYGNISANVWKYLIDISVYRDNHLRFENINFWEDFALTIDLPTYIDRAVFLSDVTYRYFSRYGTLSNNQERSRIEKDEIVKIAEVIGKLKAQGERIKGKSYYLKRCYKVMMTEFYMVCNILKHRNIIVPSFTARELRDMMRSPLSLSEVMGFSKLNLSNMLFYILGILPSRLSVIVMWGMAKMKHLV